MPFPDVISDAIHKDACMELYTMCTVLLSKFTRLALCHFTNFSVLLWMVPRLARSVWHEQDTRDRLRGGQLSTGILKNWLVALKPYLETISSSAFFLLFELTESWQSPPGNSSEHYSQSKGIHLTLKYYVVET